MTREELDQMWSRAMEEAIAAGEMFTRYRFAEMVAAAEREACAKACEAFGKTLEVDVGDCFAEAIRARGEA